MTSAGWQRRKGFFFKKIFRIFLRSKMVKMPFPFYVRVVLTSRWSCYVKICKRKHRRCDIELAIYRNPKRWWCSHHRHRRATNIQLDVLKRIGRSKAKLFICIANFEKYVKDIHWYWGHTVDGRNPAPPVFVHMKPYRQIAYSSRIPSINRIALSSDFCLDLESLSSSKAKSAFLTAWPWNVNHNISPEIR